MGSIASGTHQAQTAGALIIATAKGRPTLFCRDFFFLMLTIHFTHAENSTLKVNFEKFPLQVSLTNQPPQLGAGWNCFRLNVNEGGGTCWKKGGEFALF